MNKHLIVVSIDAMVFEDLEYAKTLPNFSKIIDNAAIIERVRTIYPSVTHPVHATIMTGAPAGVTGVTNNYVFNPEKPYDPENPWYNFMYQLKCETIFHAAKRAGLTTASASWPLTSCGNDVIDYFVPCALTSDFEGFEASPLDAYRALGAPECVMDIIAEAVKRFGWKDSHPEIEEFQAYCSAEIIKRFKPNLLLTHPSYVDNRRHASGVFTSQVTHAIYETDRWIGMLLDAVKEAGIEQETDIVLLSDHGQINITRVISPNVYFADRGYITLDKDGNLTSWKAYAKSTGASAHVYLADKTDRQLHDGVYKMLTEMADEGIYGFDRVFTVEETKDRYGLYGDFSFVLETDGYTSFGEHLVRPVVRGFDFSDYRFGKGTHGHMPEKGPQPPFVAAGPSFKKGAVVPYGSILNHAPTFAKVLGIELPDAVGKAVTEILNV